MFVRLSVPSVLNSHIKGADGADLRLLLVLEMRGWEKKETSQSGNTAQRDELSGWEMSPGAWLPFPSRDTGEKGSVCSLMCCCKSGVTPLTPQGTASPGNPSTKPHWLSEQLRKSFCP